MKIEPTGAALGARITDVDLSEPLDDAQFRRIEQALHEHEVIVFADQHLTPEAQIDFSRRFGPLERHVRQDRCLPGYPEVFIVSNIIENGRPIGSQDAGFYWHSDLCYAREPSRGSLLYAREVPTDNGEPRGDTLFASMTRAWSELPADIREVLAGRPAVNSYFAGYTRERTGEARPPLTAEQRARTPDVQHPAVRTHPQTGRPCLFVCEAYTTELVGLPEAQSRDLLDRLFEHLKEDRFVYRHQWQVGDLLMWDNCSTQHRAIIDYALPLRRRMERTTVCGGEPFWRH
jgi:taurine dioxygenase